MAVGRIALGEVAFGSVGEPFGEAGGVGEGVDFAGLALLDFHCGVRRLVFWSDVMWERC